MEEVKCPKCGSNQITANKKGFSTGRAIAGGLLTGNIWVAAAAGGVGMNEIQITCLSCGHTWKVKRDIAKQNARQRTYSGANVPRTALYKCDCGWQGNLQYGKAFCERCNKQLNDSHIVTDYHAFEKKANSSGCLVALLIPLIISLAAILL